MIVHPANTATGPALGWGFRSLKALCVASLFLTLFTTAAFAQSKASLAWTASADTTVTGYYLYQGGSSQNYTNKIALGNVSATTVSNLLAGGTYYFALTAYDAYGLESPFSNEVSYEVPANNPAPSVALTAPVSGATYSAPATVNLAASVTANGHTITQVQFYNGASLLGSRATAPYAFSWNNVSAGSYSLFARVVYDSGSTLDSAHASISVTNPLPVVPPTVVLTSPVSGASYSAPATVSLAASVTANGHTITQVQFYNGASLLGSRATAPYAFSWNNVSAGSYSLFARVVYDSGSTLDSAHASISVTNAAPSTDLPAPWQTMDIGAVGVTGSAVDTNGVFTVMGAGTVGGSIDKFRFVYQSLSGDGEIQARILADDRVPNNWAGVMIRESLTADSTYGLVGLASGNIVRFGARTTTGDNSKSSSAWTVRPPVWFRLVRSGNTLYGYKSTDGVHWGRSIARYNVPMASNVYIGLAVASGTATALNTGVFDNLTVLP